MSHGWAAPTSATTSTTRLSLLEAAFDPVRKRTGRMRNPHVGRLDPTRAPEPIKKVQLRSGNKASG